MSFLDKILGSGIKDVVSSISDVADKFITSPDEKKAFQLEVQKLALEKETKLIELAQQETDSYLKDVQSARQANVSIQESDKASWLSKNFSYFLDGAFCILFAVMLILIFRREVPAQNKELFYTGFGLLGGIVSTIINFHRGSSKGAEKSGDTVRKIASEK